MKGKKKIKYITFLQATHKWLATHNGGKLPKRLENVLEKFIVVFNTRGTQEAIRFCKERRALVYSLLSESSTGVFSSCQVKLPKDLNFLKSGERFEAPFIKQLLTILSSSRALRTEVSSDLSSITGPATFSGLPFIRKDYKRFWSSLGYSPCRKPSRSLNFKGYHRTTKSGPNGHSLMTSITDLFTISKICPSLLRNIFTLGGPKLEKYMTVLLDYMPDMFGLVFPDRYFVIGNLRRLVAFPDKEGKTREIAILDYFSQTCLRPLHKYLFGPLRKIEQDCTFNQTNVRGLFEQEGVYHSIDLKNFTDRFPIELNYRILREMIGTKKALAWRGIMSLPFESNQGTISYSVGNPMGAYSSWNSTSLAHHFVVFQACRNLNINWKKAPYRLLGDDLVIKSEPLAKEYFRLIDLLGVQWSKEKTHTSGHFFEFAKRIYWNDLDVTPFPIAALWEERDCKVLGLASVHINATDKGWFVAPSDGKCTWKDYLMLRGYPRRIRSKWCDLLTKVLTIMSVLQMKCSALELLPFVEKISPLVAKKLQGEEGKDKIFNILLSCIVQLFAESSSDLFHGKAKGAPLGLIAEELTIALTCIEEKPGRMSTTLLPESLPHTYVWGLISEDFMKSQRKAYILDTLHSGNWDVSFRNILVPTSDLAVYSKREGDTMLGNSSKIYTKFEESIKVLRQYPQLI